MISGDCTALNQTSAQKFTIAHPREPFRRLKASSAFPIRSACNG